MLQRGSKTKGSTPEHHQLRTAVLSSSSSGCNFCILLLVVFLSFAAVTPVAGTGCRMLWDQSLGLAPGVNPSGLYSNLLSTMTNQFGLDITTIPFNTSLDSVDWAGVGMLWLDAKYSGDPAQQGLVEYDDYAPYAFLRVSKAVFFFSPPGASVVFTLCRLSQMPKSESRRTCSICSNSADHDMTIKFTICHSMSFWTGNEIFSTKNTA